MSGRREISARRVLGPAAASAVADAFEAGVEWARQHPGAGRMRAQHAATAHLAELAHRRLTVRPVTIADVWERLVVRDSGTCFYCGRPVTREDATVEHLIPVAHGGTDNPGNLVLVHAACNALAGDASVLTKIRHRDRNHRAHLAHRVLAGGEGERGAAA